MSTENNYPWMQDVKPSPTAEQAALIEDLRRVAVAAQAALQTFADTNCGGYESEPWRAAYDGINEVVRTAHLKWSAETAKYTM